jgi:hypothetical protein
MDVPHGPMWTQPNLKHTTSIRKHELIWSRDKNWVKELGNINFTYVRALTCSIYGCSCWSCCSSGLINGNSGVQHGTKEENLVLVLNSVIMQGLIMNDKWSRLCMCAITKWSRRCIGSCDSYSVAPPITSLSSHFSLSFSFLHSKIKLTSSWSLGIWNLWWDSHHPLPHLDFCEKVKCIESGSPLECIPLPKSIKVCRWCSFHVLDHNMPLFVLFNRHLKWLVTRIPEGAY